MATFLIKTDKQYYMAGETVNGQVLLAVSSSISGFQGISLSLTAFQSLKWINSKPIPQPQPLSSNSPSFPLEQIYHTDKIEVSECGTQQNFNSALRPKFIRTAKNQFYEMEYNQRRNDFAKSSLSIFEGNKISAGHYCFPFSFKTFEDWPGSITFNSQTRKAQVSYKLSAFANPVTPHFDFGASKEVIIINAAPEKKGQFHNQITSCSCIAKGRTSYTILTNEKQYSSKSTNGKIIIEIDNSECTTDIKSIDVSLVSSLRFQQGNSQHKVQKLLLKSTLNGVRAQEKCIGEKAVTYNIDMSKISGVLPQSNGKFITSQNHIIVTLNYDAAFYSAKSESISFNVYGQGDKAQIPLVFIKDFKPKSMPEVTLKFQSSFKNQYLSNGFTSTQKFHTP